METALHCNDLSCRALCPDRAVVTTCSHIFCLPCADRLGLCEPKDGQRQCPACTTPLDNPDDAVSTSLNPTEDYKTSILSGFSPAVIMECAGRGLSFWSYQMTQEITYQAFLARSLTEKYSALSSHLDNTVRDANDDSQKLNQKIDALNADLAHMVETNQRLNDEVRKKTKAAQGYESMYNKLKQQQLNADVGAAADQDADNVLQGATVGVQRLSNQHTGGAPPHRSNSNGSGGSGGPHRRISLAYGNGNNQNYRPQGSRAGLGTSQSYPNATPNHGNRQRLPNPLPNPSYGQYAAGVVEGLASRNGPLRQGTPMGNSYNYATQTGYRPAIHPSNNLGLSSNVRVSRPQQPVQQNRMTGGYSAINIR